MRLALIFTVLFSGCASVRQQAFYEHTDCLWYIVEKRDKLSPAEKEFFKQGCEALYQMRLEKLRR